MKKQESKSYSDSQKKAIYRYAESHERIYLTVTQEQKNLYEKQANEAGKSLTRFILDCVDEKIANGNH